MKSKARMTQSFLRGSEITADINEALGFTTNYGVVKLALKNIIFPS